MAVKIAINGFGRIGRATFRRIIENHPNLKIEAINDLTDNKTLSHLLKYDSVYRIYKRKVGFSKNSISVDNKKFRVLEEPDPGRLPWKKLGVDIVLECTGRFREKKDAQKHLRAGAKYVIISAPAKSEGVPGFVLGVNEEKFNPKKDKIMDMGSCTTNCLAPIVKILNDNFGIISGFMTTVHSYTNDQRILDLPHSDLRRARAAALNIIPTTTGAAKAIGKIIPELNGKLDGIAIRVPTPTVSVLDLVVQVKKTPKNETEVNNIFEKSAKKLKGILKVEKEPLVSTDFIGNSHSAIIDASQTMVKSNLVKVLAWYDNEWGYSCRLAEFTEYVGRKL